MLTALARRFRTDWATVDIPKPEFIGTTRVLKRCAAGNACANYIDWSPFFLTWELKGKYPADFRRSAARRGGRKLFDDASELLDRIIDEKLLTARGVYGFWPAASEGDDIIVYADESRS